MNTNFNAAMCKVLDFCVASAESGLPEFLIILTDTSFDTLYRTPRRSSVTAGYRRGIYLVVAVEGYK